MLERAKQNLYFFHFKLTSINIIHYKLNQDILILPPRRIYIHIGAAYLLYAHLPNKAIIAIPAAKQTTEKSKFHIGPSLTANQVSIDLKVN